MLATLTFVVLLAKPDPAAEAARQVKANPPKSTECRECRAACGGEPAADCRALCDQGKVEACSMLGHRMILEKKDDKGEYRKLLERAAAQHEKMALGTLGLFYVSGQGVKKDELKGARMLGEACALEYWPACNTLGLAYEKGAGVPADPRLAGVHYESACNGGYSRSCVTLGELYEKGVGLAVDKLRGVKLYQKGCAQGHEPACAAVTRAQSEHPVDTPKSFSADMERAMKPAIEQARRSWPAAKKRYLAGLPKGETFYVTALLTDRGGDEQVFIQVQAIDVRSSEVRGALNSRPVKLKTLRPGDVVTLKDAEVLDWTISKPDGSEEGNFVGKFLDTYQPPAP